MPLSDGLRIELEQFVANPKFKSVDKAMQERFDRAIIEAEQSKSKPKTPREKGIRGMLHRVNDYRKRHVLKKVIKEKLRRINDYRKRHVLVKVMKQKLYRITPLRKAVHGIKRLFKRS